jgi:phosphoribosylamine--glycine ligase
MSRKVLVLGSGGREHCVAWTLAKSPQVAKVYVWPGNAGCAGGKLETVESKEAVPVVAKRLGVDLVFVGPEGPLVEGVADALNAAGVPCFGPTRMAAQLEWSKAFSKDFFTRHALPTARYKTFRKFDEVRLCVPPHRAHFPRSCRPAHTSGRCRTRWC